MHRGERTDTVMAPSAPIDEGHDDFAGWDEGERWLVPPNLTPGVASAPDEDEADGDMPMSKRLKKEARRTRQRRTRRDRDRENNSLEAMQEEIEYDRDNVDRDSSSSFQEYWPDSIPESERENRYNNEMRLL